MQKVLDASEEQKLAQLQHNSEMLPLMYERDFP